MDESKVSQPRWSWDYPEPDAQVRGRTLMVDGWLAGPDGDSGDREIAVVSGGEILAASTARHARPDVAAALSLTHDMVGFHLEADVRSVVADGRVVAALCTRLPGMPWQTLTKRTFSVSDAGPLPYEGAFRAAEESGTVLQRGDVYSSGPPVLELYPEMFALARTYAGRSVLDLGCGAGPYSLALAAAGHLVHGLEYAMQPVRLARQAGVSAVRGDGRHLPFRDQSFDTVLAVEAIEHIEGPEVAVAECARVTRGNLLVSVPNAAVIPHLFPWGVTPYHMLEATHMNFFSARTLEQVLRARFRHVQVGFYSRAFGFPGAPALYAHLFAVAAHDESGLLRVQPPARSGGSVGRAASWLARKARELRS